MGFACPVCEIPHQDATHLANHLAFTAMTHGDDHEAWLDDAVPEWADHGEAELASAVGDLAPEAEYDQVFEDTVGAQSGGGKHQHSHDQGPGRQPGGLDPEAAAVAGGGKLDEDARAVLEKARGLTAAIVEDGSGSGEQEGADGDEQTDADGGDSRGE